MVSRFFKGKVAPSRRCLWVLGWIFTGVITAVIAAGLMDRGDWVARINTLVVIALAVIAVAGCVDLLLLRRMPIVTLERDCSHSVAVDRWFTVKLIVHHQIRWPVMVELFDNLVSPCEYGYLPGDMELQPGRISSLEYRLKIPVRGPYYISPCDVSVPSPFGFFKHVYSVGGVTEIKVYPDFGAIVGLTLLAADHRESQIGIKRKPRRGEGLEFLQLRDYRSGDSLRKIDWKATSRRQRLISKEYQDERDQNIVILIDSGRRMRTKDDSLSHFDHSLNAMLLVAYLALRQGDSVSVMSLGSSSRWVAPQKGVGAMKSILNAMYDLHAENKATDYVAAAEKLVRLQKKRSLVIVVTNSRDEDVDDLTVASHLIKQRHLLLIANIREAIIDEVMQQEIHDFDTALMYAGMSRYVSQRAEANKQITRKGVYALDCQAHELATQVANSYLEIKRSGAL